MGAIKVVQAKRSDYSQIRELIKKFPENLVFPIPGYKSFVVAKLKNKVIGCCALDVYSKRIAEVRSVAVLPEFRRHGIMSIMVNKCLRIAEGRKIKEIFLVTSSPDIFKRFGFGFAQQEKFILFKRRV